MKNYLDRYLAGEAPLHPESLDLPTDEELDAAEAEFDRIMAERESQAVIEDKPRARIVRLWPWAAAASVLLLIGVGAMLLTNDLKPQEEIVAKIQENQLRDSVQKQEPIPVIPLETADTVKKIKEKYRMPQPPKHYMAKAETGVGSQETGVRRQETGVRSQETEVIDEQEFAEIAFAEEKRRLEMEMMAQMSGSLEADFKAMTDEIRSRGERMTQHVEMAMSNKE